MSRAEVTGPAARGAEGAPAGAPPSPAPARKGSVWGTVKAVAWSFVGLRRGADLERDSARLNPLHVVAVGFAGVVVFVLALVVLVNVVVAG